MLAADQCDFRSMNFLTIIEDRIRRLRPSEYAESLIATASHCLALSRKGDMGRQISLALVEPSGLSPPDAEALYFQLEDLYTAEIQSEVEASEARAISEWHGASVDPSADCSFVKCCRSSVFRGRPPRSPLN
jgi:hypothetical protein